MVDPLKRKKQDLGLLVFLLVVTALLVTKGNLTGFAVAGAITTGTELRWANGTTATLLYDNNSQTYGDSSLVNGNMYLHICSTVGGATDLINNYVKLVYRMQANEIDLTALPAQITSGSVTGNCADIDLDLSTFAAYYPGIVTVVLDSSPTFPSPIQYYPLTQITGILDGNYTIVYSQIGPNISINTSLVYDDLGNLITADLPFMIVGIKNSSGSLLYSGITQPGQLIEFPFPTDSNFTFVVNNFDVPLAYDLNTPEICDNNIDEDGDFLIDCADPECVNAPNCQPPAEPSGGGGGGGGSYCRQKWVCGEWSNCHPDSIQTRECIDINDCLNRSQIKYTRLVANPKPDETQSCTYVPACDDQYQNQDETDLDCGGGICAGCDLGKHCLLNSDCLSSNCLKGYCRPSGVQCYEDADCPIGFTCEQFECLFLKVFRKPASLSPLEKYILWGLLALILTLSSYAAYEHYKKSPYHKKVEKTKEKTKKTKEKEKEKQELEKYSQILGDFIKKATLQGHTKEQIKKSLKEKGWPEKTINQYLKKLYQQPSKPKAQKATHQAEIKEYEQELKRLK